jgi:hypothetical protein
LIRVTPLQRRPPDAGGSCFKAPKPSESCSFRQTQDSSLKSRIEFRTKWFRSETWHRAVKSGQCAWGSALGLLLLLWVRYLLEQATDGATDSAHGINHQVGGALNDDIASVPALVGEGGPAHGGVGDVVIGVDLDL